MAEWKECLLSDLGTVVGGATPSTKNPTNYEGGTISWITPKDLADFKGRYIAHGERMITEAGLSSCSTQLMPTHSVLFSSRAPIGYVAIAANELCTNQGFKSVVPNEGTDYLFLYYLLKFNKDAIENLGSGTTFKEVSGSTMRNVKVRVPVLLSEQKKIASVLGAIDDKIEENERINNNLSEQIQAIYREDFDPTTHKPTGFLSDICHYSSERISISDLSVSTYFSTENMQPNKAGAVNATSLPTISQTTKCHKGDVLISNIRPYFKKIVYVSDECGCSTDVLCFVPNDSSLSAFLFSTVYADRFFDYMVAGSKGTKMPRGDKQQIMKYPVVVPSTHALISFSDTVKPMLETIANNRAENIRLADIRDALLPRLMSGELDVSELDI